MPDVDSNDSRNSKRIEELEEEIKAERSARKWVEKQRSELQRELEILADHLEETGGVSQSQLEFNKKREIEIQRLQRDLEDAQAQNEAQINIFKKKHQELVNDCSEQIEQTQKAKQKIEKEKNQLQLNNAELTAQIESISKNNKINIEKLIRQQEAIVAEFNIKLNDSQKEVTELSQLKSKMQAQNSEFLRRVEDLELQINQLLRVRISLTQQLEDAKSTLEDETENKNKYANELKSAQLAIAELKEKNEEEINSRIDIQRQLNKIQNEYESLKQKFDMTESFVQPEELDDIKRKLGVRIQDGEAQLDAALNKLVTNEKLNAKLQLEIDALNNDLEKSQTICLQMEKKLRLKEKSVEEWKRRTVDLETEIEKSHSESKRIQAESFKYKISMDETQETCENYIKEIRRLQDEIQDSSDQLAESSKRVQDLEKIIKNIESDKEELLNRQENLELCLQQEQTKHQRTLSEVTVIRSEMERRILEKDEELEILRKTHQRALDEMQLNLETEGKNRIDIIRSKKKLEQEILELETALDISTKARSEVEKNFKRFHQQMKELQAMVDEEQIAAQEAKAEQNAAERRSASLAIELDQLRIQIESLEKESKQLQNELHEAIDRFADASTEIQTLTLNKRKLENDLQSFQSEIVEKTTEINTLEERLIKTSADVTRLTETLKQEQEHSEQLDRSKKAIESHFKDMKIRLEETESSAIQGGKKIIQKMEQKVNELENELEAEQHRHNETVKAMRRQERRLKELAMQMDDDRQNHDKLRDIIEKLHAKLKSFKRQVDETEEVANLNLSKYKKFQQEMEGAIERADNAENKLGILRVKGRSSSIAPNGNEHIFLASMKGNRASRASSEINF